MIDAAAAAIGAGGLAIVPTDTVYGLATTPHDEEAVRRLYRAKGRADLQPTALVAADLETLFACVPELREHAGAVAAALLPGPYTLVLPNPGRRYRWLTGSRPDTIGVRVPDLSGYGKQLLERVGAVAATSANLHGAPDPCTVGEIPQELIDGIAELVDAGPLPGTPSTVIDFTGPEPTVIREGAGDVGRALAAVG